MAAASGAGVAATATTAAVAGAAELSIAGGAAAGAGVVGTGLTVAGVGGRIYSGTEDGPMVPGKPKTPSAAPRGPQRGDSQNAPGGQKGPALTINQVKRAMGQAGLPDVSGYDIEHVPSIEQPNGGSAWGDSPVQHRAWEHGLDIGIPETGQRGRPLIRVTDKALGSMEEAVKTIHHETYHHQTQHQLGEHFEQQAEAYADRIWGMFVRRMERWL